MPVDQEVGQQLRRTARYSYLRDSPFFNIGRRNLSARGGFAQDLNHGTCEHRDFPVILRDSAEGKSELLG